MKQDEAERLRRELDRQSRRRERRRYPAALRREAVAYARSSGMARPENNVAFFAIAEAFLSVHLGGSYQPITDDELKASSMQIVAGKQWLPGLPATAAPAK